MQTCFEAVQSLVVFALAHFSEKMLLLVMLVHA